MGDVHFMLRRQQPEIMLSESSSKFSNLQHEFFVHAKLFLAWFYTHNAGIFSQFFKKTTLIKKSYLIWKRFFKSHSLGKKHNVVEIYLLLSIYLLFCWLATPAFQCTLENRRVWFISYHCGFIGKWNNLKPWLGNNNLCISLNTYPSSCPATYFLKSVTCKNTKEAMYCTIISKMKLERFL